MNPNEGSAAKRGPGSRFSKIADPCSVEIISWGSQCAPPIHLGPGRKGFLRLGMNFFTEANENMLNSRPSPAGMPLTSVMAMSIHMCMPVCMYRCLCVTHTCIWVQVVHICVKICVHAHVHVYICKCMCIYASACVCVCVCVRTHFCVCVQMCMSMYIPVHMCVEAKGCHGVFFDQCRVAHWNLTSLSIRLA